MTDDLKPGIYFRWELTKLQAMKGVKIVSMKDAHDRPEWLPAALTDSIGRQLPKRPLEGTDYKYQLALSSSSNLRDIVPVVQAHPRLAGSGDDRSGIVVFDGEQVVGGYWSLGASVESGRWKLYVRPDYRGKLTALHLLLQWFKEVPRVVPLQTPYYVNQAGANLLEKARVEAVKWALAAGKAVPGPVLAELS